MCSLRKIEQIHKAVWIKNEETTEERQEIEKIMDAEPANQ
jgi:predicted DNA-binding ArsR family transcriptional regulator